MERRRTYPVSIRTTSGQVERVSENWTNCPAVQKRRQREHWELQGVCLLPMISRILAKRLREWTEENGILDDNQSGFRPGRSTADATQIIIRVQEDMSFIKRRRTALEMPTHLPSDPVGRLLDLEKAYPRVSKPALWEILRRHGMKGTFLNCLMDLHETTVKGKEGDSDHWIPQRGLREGYPTSPVLFNVFHQAVIQAAERKRNERAVSSGESMGIAWNWIDNDKIPSSEQTGKFNSEAKRTHFSISLFADDTTVLGTAEEMEQGCQAIKETMQVFEEKNNEKKEENSFSEMRNPRRYRCWAVG